ncbi:MAG: ATPase [Bacteroidetes bacterium GWF2_38_335]|nr:MAG: ATPase [Bacteroidetes bacterium GWF2_38_335]OFY80330.1 MAG: ATPase [Bacteroidetes bacterium RIFOXYA12_FULL_38_20]HBS88869.1 ATPase [Bacteroidales bacterium]
MKIPRHLSHLLRNNLGSRKALILYGARQTGKTTLLKHLIEENQKVLWINADTFEGQQFFNHTSLERYKRTLADKDLLIVDEAQRIDNIGIKLKILLDELPVKIIATGSSSFDLANKINEPLTGRKTVFTLFPLSFNELKNHLGLFDELNALESRLIFGSYPEVISNPGNETAVLSEIVDSYLFKDIFSNNKIKKSDKMVRLIQALAFQTGQLVSYNELSNLTGLNHETVERYIDLLEQSFVLFRVSPYSSNPRNELKNLRKIFFFDNGVRNTLINNFNKPDLRNDIGQLWENYIISERVKFLNNEKINTKIYFWRNHNRQEIDLVEQNGSSLDAYEIKWKTTSKYRFPDSFVEKYKPKTTSVISRDNYESFISS